MIKPAVWFFVCFVIGSSVGGALAVAVHKTDTTKLQRCMVYLPDLDDAKFKRWCLRQSEKMP